MKIFGITGWKNSGKTTLVSKLVTELTNRGFAVSTVKRTHHNVDLDRPGTDSHQHRAAGAQEVLLASDKRYAILREFPADAPTSFEDMLARLDPVDIVLVEGFKTGSHAKIECHRAGCERPLFVQSNETVVAVATDVALDIQVPILAIDDVAVIADFVLTQVGLKQPENAANPDKETA